MSSIVVHAPIDPSIYTVDAVRELVASVLPNWPVERAWLFGSVARGDQGSASDVDIAVLLVDGARLGLAISQLQWELEDALLCDVDVVVAPVSDRRRDFHERYEREKVLIYERSQH